MNIRWFLPLLIFLICCSCSNRAQSVPQPRQNTVVHNLRQSSDTPNLLDGSEQAVRTISRGLKG